VGEKISPGTISNLNKKAYGHIEKWRSRPLTGNYPYVYDDGIYLKRSWGGEIQNVAVLIAIGVAVADEECSNYLRFSFSISVSRWDFVFQQSFAEWYFPKWKKPLFHHVHQTAKYS